MTIAGFRRGRLASPIHSYQNYNNLRGTACPPWAIPGSNFPLAHCTLTTAHKYTHVRLAAHHRPYSPFVYTPPALAFGSLTSFFREHFCLNSPSTMPSSFPSESTPLLSGIAHPNAKTLWRTGALFGLFFLEFVCIIARGVLSCLLQVVFGMLAGAFGSHTLKISGMTVEKISAFTSAAHYAVSHRSRIVDLCHMGRVGIHLLRLVGAST
jgi:hypothetical protein